MTSFHLVLIAPFCKYLREKKLIVIQIGDDKSVLYQTDNIDSNGYSRKAKRRLTNEQNSMRQFCCTKQGPEVLEKIK